ncbi:DUF4148 domain-containing protein [Aquincola sp. J276]|uniref:DUF4148 domain-containing protein n=1 Tax=Aquincola sp. J276 TaxID=2898432 RepID=UPI002151544E|nr:DUF4148 domain-containing protein [Aquincola sp. J276]MCR5864579.1 DUF4148 domain-containing protein [Aquincola sp. J276]
MSSFKFAFATVAVITAVALPGLSQATSLYHAADGEAGFTYHPDHAKNGKTRAEVLAELDAARKDGTLAQMQRNAPVTVRSTGPGKTRQEVLNEMRNESPEARRERLEMTAF